MLQTRTGKRTARAAVKVAYDMVHEGLISKKEALLRVEPEQLDQLLHRQIDPRPSLRLLPAGFRLSRRSFPARWFLMRMRLKRPVMKGKSCSGSK